MAHAEKLLTDPAIAANLLEECAAAVSRVLQKPRPETDHPIRDLQAALNPGWEVGDPSRMRNAPDPYHQGEQLVEQLTSGEWVERAPYFDAVAVNGDGVFDTLKAVSKLVLKSLA